jgi:hypothetical protein
MTLERLTLAALLSMVLTGSAVYVLTEPSAGRPAPSVVLAAATSGESAEPVKASPSAATRDVGPPSSASSATSSLSPGLLAACCDPLPCALDSKRVRDLEEWFGLNPDGTCRRCPSGRTTIPVCCETSLPSQNWSTRASKAIMRGPLDQEVRVEDVYPSAVLCMRPHLPQEWTMSVNMSCVPLRDVAGGRIRSSKSLLILSTDDLTKGGLDILVHDGQGNELASKSRARHASIGPGALCVGLRFRDLDSKVLREPRVTVFLDDPPNP